METPKEFQRNIKKGVITIEMLESVLYSINKRAKNYRDLKREYKHSDYYDVLREKEKDLYSMKDFLLRTLLKPVCIHKEVFKRRERIWWEEDEKEEWREPIYEEREEERYYLFYQLPNTSFHLPIEEEEVETYKEEGLEIKDIDNLDTHGENPPKLISLQFCRKFVELVKSGNYVLLDNDAFLWKLGQKTSISTK